MKAKAITPQMQQLIDDIKAEGLLVFGPEDLSSYVFFTDGIRVGYAQYDKREGVSYSTTHKACRTVGTGFKVDSLQEALLFAPAWADNRQRAAVCKYKDFEEFKSQNWQPLIQY